MNIQESLDPDEKAAAHVASHLIGETVASISRLTTGNQNYVYAVDTEQSTYVIRMTNKFRDKFVSALHWQEQLIPLDVPLAKFIAQDLDGQYSPFPALLMKRLPGADIGRAYPSLTAEQKKSIARQMVDIHAKLDALPDGSKYGYTPNPPHETWVDFLTKDLNVASDRVFKAQIFDKGVVEIAFSELDSLKEDLLKIRPRPFMPDTTVKNVIIHEGALMGIVDVDDICYGDPLFTLSLTYAGSEIDGLDTDYADAWARSLDLDLHAQCRLEFYRLLHTIWFMGEQAIVSANGQKLNFDTEKLKQMFDGSVERLREKV
ncbi:MAG: phosphotransferase [Rhodospirillales bacterium]|nr:phosphotransferase [Rhodospirillales bacterium]MCB9964517.1 phosphotransferase [Rhodospirillales bacterium]MCB9973790.1 phosphotransferase [Rhodospirillales bacterium]MCB9980326.1 phosphotransferase [Rhodospirillales bacterium]